MVGKFQSLLGILKSSIAVYYGLVWFKEFQSLLGILKSPFLSRDDHIDHMFQSLLGILKSIVCVSYLCAYCVVSIPPRYSKI